MTALIGGVFALRGVDEDGQPWKLEAEVDCLKIGDPHVITVVTEDEETNAWTMAVLSPDDARDMAAALIELADSCAATNERRGRKS